MPENKEFLSALNHMPAAHILCVGNWVSGCFMDGVRGEKYAPDRANGLNIPKIIQKKAGAKRAGSSIWL